MKGKNERIKNKNVHEAGDPSLPPKKKQCKRQTEEYKVTVTNTSCSLLSKRSEVTKTYERIPSNSNNLYLLEPGLMIQHFKLHQYFGQFVVILDDSLGLRALQYRRILLKQFHWLLNSPIHLSRPGYFACYGR